MADKDSCKKRKEPNGSLLQDQISLRRRQSKNQMTEIVQKTQLTPEIKHKLFRHTKKMGLKRWT